MIAEPLREIWQSRELLAELSLRDVRIRYKQTALGFAWALFTPVLMMVIFTQVFARSAKVDTGPVPYALFVYCGLLPWQFFASCLKGSVESLTRNSRLVTKVYMPREVFPLSVVGSAFVDFLVASVVLVGLMAWYGFAPDWRLAAFVPLVLAVQLALSVGLGLLLSMANLFYRDVKYLFEVALLLWMFATSVIYPIKADGLMGAALALNPMTPIIDSYRRLLLMGEMPDPLGFGYACALSAALLVLGLKWFHEAEFLFAEHV